MIVGSGSVAKLLNDREGAVFFVSGVGDSGCVDDAQFDREVELLYSHRMYYEYRKSLFYFSTISINLVDTPYTRHKKWMEDCVRRWFDDYNIIRLGNIWECTNPNTFRNYILEGRKFGADLEIRDEWKYMISKQQLNLITDNLPLTGRNEISIFGEMKKVKDCL